MENQSVITPNASVGLSNQPDQQKVKPKRRISKIQLIAFALIFAIIGTVIIIRSMAATPTACSTVYSQTSGDISTFVSQAPAGSVICLNAGNYLWNNQAVISKGSETIITASANYSAKDVKITDQATGGAVTIPTGSNNLTFNNVTINGAQVGSSNGFANHIHFTNVIFTGIVCIDQGDPAITKTQMPQDALIDHSLFDNIAYGSRKDACGEGRLNINGDTTQGNRTSSGGVTISNNVFNGSGPTNDTCTDGIFVTGGAFGTVISGNEFKNMNNTGCINLHSDPIQLSQAGRTSITGNYFHDNWSGIMMLDGSGKQYTDLDIRNNVFVNSFPIGSNPAQITIVGGLGDVIDHNVFAGTSLVRIADLSPTYPASTYQVVSNNVFTSESKLLIDRLNPTITVRNNLASTATAAGTGGSIGSPTFTTSPATNHNDYILKPGTLGTGIAVNQTGYPNFLGADLGVFAIADVKPGPVSSPISVPTSIYITPPSGTVQRDSEITVTLRENSGISTINAVAAIINYPSNLLDFVSADTTGSAFGITAVNSGGNGKIDIQRANVTALSGDNLIAKIKFHVKDTAGTAQLSFSDGTQLVSNKTSSNILVGTYGAQYTITGASKQWAGFTETNAAGSGTTPASPSAVSPSSGRVDLFVRKSDSTVWQTTSTNGKWSKTWAKVPNAKSATPITSISTKANTIDIFYAGSDNLIRQQTWNGSSWSAPTTVGTQTTNANPGVVQASSDKIDLFATALDGKVYRATKTSTGWGAWSAVSGVTSAGGLSASPVSPKSNTIDLFFTGTDYKVYRASWNGSSWATPVKVDDKTTYSGSVAVVKTPGYEDLFIKGTDNVIYQKSWDGYLNNWSAWSSRGGSTALRPAVTSQGPGQMFLFITLTNGSVQDNSYQ